MVTHASAAGHIITAHSLNSTAVFDIVQCSLSSVAVQHIAQYNFMYILRHVNVVAIYDTLIFQELHQVCITQSMSVDLFQPDVPILTNTEMDALASEMPHHRSFCNCKEHKFISHVRV